jgi:hypothetical protein
MLWLAPALLASALATTAPGNGGLLSAPDRRVRSTDPRIVELLEAGMQRSPTFAGLVKSVSATDVIVYIERVRDLPRSLGGRLLLMPIASSQRYLRIQVRGDLPRRDLIALIGHELRHALEIAQEPTVRDNSSMISLFQRIGRSSRQTHTFDTTAAQNAGWKVRQELAG